MAKVKKFTYTATVKVTSDEKQKLSTLRHIVHAEAQYAVDGTSAELTVGKFVEVK